MKCHVQENLSHDFSLGNYTCFVYINYLCQLYLCAHPWIVIKEGIIYYAYLSVLC